MHTLIRVRIFQCGCHCFARIQIQVQSGVYYFLALLLVKGPPRCDYYVHFAGFMKFIFPCINEAASCWCWAAIPVYKRYFHCPTPQSVSIISLMPMSRLITLVWFIGVLQFQHRLPLPYCSWNVISRRWWCDLVPLLTNERHEHGTAGGDADAEPADVTAMLTIILLCRNVRDVRRLALACPSQHGD